MTYFLKNLDYDNNICLFSHRVTDLGHLALNLEASRVELKISTNKTKVLSLTVDCTPRICINGQSIEDADQFVYLGGVFFPDDGTELDVARRINNTRSAFVALSEI